MDWKKDLLWRARVVDVLIPRGSTVYQLGAEKFKFAGIETGAGVCQHFCG